MDAVLLPPSHKFVPRPVSACFRVFVLPVLQVLVLGRPPFHDTELTTSGHLAYVGGNWTRDIAFAGTSIPLTVRTHTLQQWQHGTSCAVSSWQGECGCPLW